MSDAPPLTILGALLVPSVTPSDCTVAELLQLWKRSSSPDTIRAVRSDLRNYQHWLSLHRKPPSPLPASQETICRYIDWMREGPHPYALASIERAVATLGKLHRLAQVEDPTRGAAVYWKLRGLRRNNTSAQRQAKALRVDAPGMNVELLLSLPAQRLSDWQERALLSTAYDTGLRSVELVRVQVHHILEQNEGSYELYIPASKSSHLPTTAVLSIQSVWHIRAWIMRAGLPTAGPDDLQEQRVNPLFRTIRNGQVGSIAIHRQTVVRHLRRLIARGYVALGYTPDRAGELAMAFTAHSTRVGLAQDHLQDNVELPEIAQALRIAPAGLALRYAGRLDAKLNPAAASLAKLRPEPGGGR